LNQVDIAVQEAANTMANMQVRITNLAVENAVLKGTAASLQQTVNDQQAKLDRPEVKKLLDRLAKADAKPK